MVRAPRGNGNSIHTSDVPFGGPLHVYTGLSRHYHSRDDIILQARKEHQEVRKGQFPHLPAEIWEMICKLLSTRELARALVPSCMALHG